MEKRLTKVNDKEILSGIKNKNENVLHFIYDNLLPVVKRYILKNSGNKLNAEDIFQEALLILFDKLRKEELYLSCGFSTYFIAVCKKLWLNQLRKRSYNIINYSDDIEHYNVFEKPFEPNTDSEFTGLFFRHFNKMSEKCQQVLILHFKKVPASEIAIKLGFKNKEYAISRKYKCLKRLITSIKSDPELENIIVEDERIELF